MTLVTPTFSSHPDTGRASGSHPLAPRMTAIAFLAYNLTIGCIFGSYGVLIAPIEAKLGVTRDQSSLGIPVIMLAIALTAPVVGILVEKISIKFLMLLGASLLITGFALLAVAAKSFAVFLTIYGFLLGPGTCLLATMLPSILVMRWCNVNRGRALGIVNMPLLLAGIFPLVALVLTRYGLTATYLMLAGLMLLLLPALLLVVDYPTRAIDQRGEDPAAEAAAPSSMGVGELLGSAGFWNITLAYAAIMIGATVFAAHIGPLATGWGIDAARAAGLLTASSIGGIAGSVIFGWAADRLGGAVTIVILCINSAILWALVLLHPPFAVLLLLAALMGLHGASVIVVVAMALSQRFGQASFGRAFGLSNLVTLPCAVLGVPIAGHVYIRTGSYEGAVTALIIICLLGALSAAMSLWVTPFKSNSLPW